mgnify:CR=1 FL=1
MDGGAETPQTFSCADSSRTGNVFQGQFFGKVFLDKGNHGENPILIFLRRMEKTGIGIFNFVQQKQPNLTEQISGSEFGICFCLQFAELLQFFDSVGEISDADVFAADIDGTLVDKGKNMHEETRQALTRLHEKGVLIGVASGRPLDHRTVEKSREWNLPFGFDFAIGMNGGDLWTKPVLGAAGFAGSCTAEGAASRPGTG